MGVRVRHNLIPINRCRKQYNYFFPNNNLIVPNKQWDFANRRGLYFFLMWHSHWTMVNEHNWTRRSCSPGVNRSSPYSPPGCVAPKDWSICSMVGCTCVELKCTPLQKKRLGRELPKCYTSSCVFRRNTPHTFTSLLSARAFPYCSFLF